MAVFYTMPLALMAIASYLDPKKYEVVIIDGRIEKNIGKRLIEELKGAICLGITVLTGAPIKDAIYVSQLAKEAYPSLPIVWGGWHPSLFPEETLNETPADIVVKGQGELTFAELLEKLILGYNLTDIEGISYKMDNKVIHNKERPLCNINDFPSINYKLIDVASYKKLSGRNQIDYIASQGCRFRCAFCADPTMYKRGWYGYSPNRLANELQALWNDYQFDHVHFQDETFFTNSKRVSEIADEFIKRAFPFTWFATIRADQGDRIDMDVLRQCKTSGLERVMIGIESGSQRMLNWMKKDIKVEQVFRTAQKFLDIGISINFSVIIGFPGETNEDISETLDVIRRIRKMSPEFRFSIFYFKPYPGNEIANQLITDGYKLPSGISEWAEFDYVGSDSPWLNRKSFYEIENFKFYQKLAWSKQNMLFRPLQFIAAWRCNNSYYFLPVERFLFEKFFPQKKLS